MISLFDVVQLEYRPCLAVQVDAPQCIRHESAGELAHLAMRARLIDQHPVDIRPQQVAQDAQMQRQIRMHQAAGLRPQALLMHDPPQLAQIHHVGLHGLRRRIFRGRAHDVPRILSRLDAGLNRSAQALALALIFDARRNADAMPFRHVHEVSGRQSDIRGQTSALGPQRIFHDLDQYLVAFGNQRADVFGARRLEPQGRMTRIEYVRGVQERGAFHADIDECRLHARKHPRHASLVDVADQPTAAGAL